jgi:hypothetical protein
MDCHYANQRGICPALLHKFAVRQRQGPAHRSDTLLRMSNSKASDFCEHVCGQWLVAHLIRRLNTPAHNELRPAHML